ncbi:mechanosensitive ion channel family protein [Simiduia sp. 21SJ11W-1]|uniref:mechanosensitive ion channel family protein n=1 Tax=Simiduia sp. 21SJ11W-1 TaxID=2909669 RepID=UPI0020A2329B|nr:mechanosensitive ion channel family protein [Simiduia sp. 21SJ11W-1]UTA47840.1 mechanosensitive ion channel family protein [Simiduia sp. 21SJ11W-1]
MNTDLQQVSEIYQLIAEFLVAYSFQLLGALIIFIAGWIVAGKVAALVQRLCEARDIDVTLSRFIGSTAKMVLLLMVAIMALGQLGISVTPFVAAVGALTFGLSLAAQGLVSNYGAGVNIIIGRPFVVGDTISVCGVSGQVTDVRLGQTRLINEDKVTITIPNKHIIGEILHNSHAHTLVEAQVGVAYGCDMSLALSTIEQAIRATDGVAEGAPVVGIENFGDSSVNVGYRYKVATEKLFQTKFAVNKAIFDGLKAAAIEIPFPQREVKLTQSR